MAEAETTATTSNDGNVTPIRSEVERSASLEIVAGQKWWTTPQIAALESIGLGDCPDADRMAFLHLCQATGLDPFRREIYLLGRKVKDGNAWRVRWTPQTGIDGFRHLAEESGVYGGRVGPHWTSDGETWRAVWSSRQGPPVASRCGVIRTDRPHRCRQCGGEPGGPQHGTEGALRDGQHAFDDERVTWAVAHWDEYVPMEKIYAGEGQSRRATGEEQPTSMWRKMPSAQLAKCAEAAAIRAAFPRRAAGLYEHAEMDAATQASSELQEAERDRQRRELADRPWAPTPSGEAGVVLDVKPVVTDPIDRAALLAELEDLARAAGKTVGQFTTRWAAAHRKNITEATDDELEAFLAPRRTTVTPAVEEAAERPADAPEGPGVPAEHGLTVHDQARPSPEAVTDDDRAPGDGQVDLLEMEDPSHPFEAHPDDPKRCVFCGVDPDDNIHKP